MRAFMFLYEKPKRKSKSISSNARTISGAAQVKVLDRYTDGTATVQIVKSTEPTALLEGKRTVHRRDLFINHEELDYFESMVKFYWGKAKGQKPGDRPKIDADGPLFMWTNATKGKR